MFDEDKGLKGMVINHEPLNELQLKKLLLVFDDLTFVPPDDNLSFLEKGAITYFFDIKNIDVLGKTYAQMVNLNTVNGFELLDWFKHTGAKPPEIPKDNLEIASILHYSDRDKTQRQTIVINDILKNYRGQYYKEVEEKLFDKFERVIGKGITILDYKKSDYYPKNSISLKFAYDCDSSDSSVQEILFPLLKEENIKGNQSMIFPGFPLPTINNINVFKSKKYTFPFRDNSLFKDNGYELQFLSIVGKFNHRLSLSEHYKLSPIFIDESIHNFYQYKISQLKQIEHSNVNSEWEKLHSYKLSQLNNLLFKISSEFIPDNILDKVSIPQILSYKDRCIDELYLSRRELSKDIIQIIKSDYKTDMVDVNEFLVKKLIPSFEKYQQRKQGVFNKSIKGSIKYIAPIAGGMIGLVEGISPRVIAFLASAAPVLIEQLNASVSNILKEKMKSNYENTFSYFYNFNKQYEKF